MSVLTFGAIAGLHVHYQEAVQGVMEQLSKSLETQRKTRPGADLRLVCSQILRETVDGELGYRFVVTYEIHIPDPAPAPRRRTPRRQGD